MEPRETLLTLMSMRLSLVPVPPDVGAGTISGPAVARSSTASKGKGPLMITPSMIYFGRAWTNDAFTTGVSTWSNLWTGRREVIVVGARCARMGHWPLELLYRSSDGLSPSRIIRLSTAPRTTPLSRPPYDASREYVSSSHASSNLTPKI